MIFECFVLVLTDVLSTVSVHSILLFFFRQKTAYEMRISDWSSDVCSADLVLRGRTRARFRLCRRDRSRGAPYPDRHFVPPVPAQRLRPARLPARRSRNPRRSGGTGDRAL